MTIRKMVLYVSLLCFAVAMPVWAGQGDPVREGKEVTYGVNIGSGAYLDDANITDGNIPYMQAAGAGFGDSPLSTDGTDLTNSGDLTVSGGDLTLGTSTVAGTVALHDAGTTTYYDDGDDTNVVIGPVADGTTTLGLTGSMNVSGDIGVNGITIANTSEPALSISMTSISGTDNQAIDITGGESLDANDEWTGIRIKPDDLDPGGKDTKIRGLAVNTSGVNTANNPDMQAVRITAPQGGRALVIDEGEFHQEATAGSSTDATYTAYELNINASSLDASSTFRGLNVETTGTTSGTIVALCAKPGVAPLCQQLGTFSTPDQAEYAARFPDGGSYTDGIDGNEIFVDDDDAIYIGAASEFSSLEVIFSSTATKTVFPTFWYYNTSSTWVQFYPGDSTDGFVRNGLIVWKSSNFTNWKSDYDPGGAEGSAGYWIKIVRTRVADPGTVTPTTIKLLSQTYYGWSSAGAITNAGATHNGVLTVNPDGTNETFQVNDGTIDFTDGDAGTTGTLTIDSSGNWSYNKNFSATDLDGILGSNTPAAISGTTISGTGVMTVSPDGTNEVFQVNDGTIDFTDGNAGTTGTLTVDSSGNLSYNKNIAATDLDGIIGSNTPAAGTFTTLATTGGVIIDYVAVNDTARTNTTLSTDHIVEFIALTATRNYQISSEDVAQAGRVFVVKDGTGDAMTFPITVTCEGGELIDGAATLTINAAYGAVSLFSNGTALRVY